MLTLRTSLNPLQLNPMSLLVDCTKITIRRPVKGAIDSAKPDNSLPIRRDCKTYYPSASRPLLFQSFPPTPPPQTHTHTLENPLHKHRPWILQFQITRPPTIFHRTPSWLVHMNIWNKFTLFLCFQWNWACTCSGLQQTPKSTRSCWEGKHKNLDIKKDNITSIKAWEKHYITI